MITWFRRCASGSTRNERATIGGRAAIRLAERTAEWSARPSSRYLPSWWEWLVIVLFARRSRRQSPERRLIRAATRYHAARAAALAVAVSFVCLMAVDRLGMVRARAAVRELENTEAHNVPDVIRNLASYRHWADPLLRAVLADQHINSRGKARAAAGATAGRCSQADALFGPLIDGEPELFVATLTALCKHGDRPASAAFCRETLINVHRDPDRRLRAGMALAHIVGEGAAHEDFALRARPTSWRANS